MKLYLVEHFQEGEKVDCSYFGLANKCPGKDQPKSHVRAVLNVSADDGKKLWDEAQVANFLAICLGNQKVLHRSQE